jgi:glucokinase
MTTFAIGVDLGGTNLRIAAVDSRGNILEKITTGTEVARGRDHVIDEMCACVRALALKHRVSSELAGIGVGVPGIIDMERGMVRASPNLPGWEDYPVLEKIEGRLATAVILENDANAAALGEKWLGAAATVDDMCMLTLGTGVGGGVVLQGRVWHGMTGMAAELGHINVEPEGRACNCGSRGCLEQYASATAVKQMALEAIASGNAPELARAMNQDPEFSSKVVHHMALQGDEHARKIFRRVGTSLGIVLADLINIFNLPMYVIGGGVASAWDVFAPAMLETAARYSYVYRATAPSPQESRNHAKDRASEPGKRSIVTQALLGSDAGLIGAARLPLIAVGAESREREMRQS